MAQRLTAAAVALFVVVLVVIAVRSRRLASLYDESTMVGYADFDVNLSALQQRLSSERLVSCGSDLAASCAACGQGGACLGDCVWTDGQCVEIIPGEPRPVYTGADQKLLAGKPVQVVDTSRLATAVLTLLLAGSRPATDTTQARRCMLASGLQPCVTAADDAISLNRRAVFSVAELPTGSAPPCRCPTSHPSGSWLHSRLTSNGQRGGLNWSVTAHVALVRDPLEMLENEILAQPSPQWVGASLELCMHSGQSVRATWGPNESIVCTRRLLATFMNDTEDRFRVLAHCCQNPLARRLVRSLPRSATVRQCAIGECDTAVLHALAERALLRMEWVGSMRLLQPSLELLSHTLQLALPKIRRPELRMLQSASWPWGRDKERTVPLTARQAAQWQTLSAVDMALFGLAGGLVTLRRRASQASISSTAWRATPPRAERVHDGPVVEPRKMVGAARVFGTDFGSGRRPAAVVGPITFDHRTDTLVFLHLAKCGGTSFNVRLTTLDPGVSCMCPDRKPTKYHNGHAIVQPRSCICPRRAKGTQLRLEWSSVAMRTFNKRRRMPWAFLQKQWLVSPETTGWIGGVHAPVRVLQNYLMLAAKLTTGYPLARGIHYVALLREPTTRFLSEFYETHDGWEAHFNTPPRLDDLSTCSSRLAPHLRRRARLGIDNCTKAEYDELFPEWIRCPTNMAANRQTRALAYNYIGNDDDGKEKNGGMLARSLCGDLPGGKADERCTLQIARRALYQLSFLGLNDARCASEKLFEAQFGMRFDPKGVEAKGVEAGKGAHKVAKLTLRELSKADQRRVRWLNRNDLMLYAEAKRLFYERLRAYGIPRTVEC